MISNYFKFFFLFIFFLILKHPSYAETKVAIIDLDLILSDSKNGKKILLSIDLNKKKKFKEFEEKEKLFRNDEKKLIASQTIISNDQFNQNLNDFKKKIDEYKTFKSNELKKLQEIQNKEIINFFNSINPIIQDFMEKNSISILLDKKNIYVADKKLDISLDIIDIINK